MDGLAAPSPSHSGATSGGGAAHRKRKLPPSSLSDATADEDDDTTAPSSPSTAPSSPSRPSSPSSSHSDDDDDDSMQTFTAARLDAAPGSASGRPPKPDSSSVSATAAAAAAVGGPKTDPGSAAAGDGKEDPKGLFTDNLQTSGAYSAREEGLKREEDSGRLKFLCYSNDGIDEHMIWLVGLKNIFARQLPNMPKDIVRLVMDRTHKSMMVIRNNIVVGGITYRPYASQRFGEIAFCAITADEQVKGYGTRYIKDYDGGILMECKIDPKLPYVDLATMIRRQRQAIDEKIRELSNCHIVYSGIDFQKSMNEHTDAWPFKEPVDSRDVPDYYDIIKDPIDLRTMSRRVESEQYYVTLEMFVADMKRMFNNARTYNSPDTIYYKCATRLENFFSSKIASQLQQGSTKS
ncbi:hypothetical protein PR202_gb08015 [Eleusine coracana subsp. coracana]|uniref:Bromo domain-containing protein n=1 Tax=Eleusine coracana subsp. coracana TaxID=191504 RepID=A0AAV5EDK3_ELECO|nr:hypothetical protein PR202_gb08015 [Eleusine coracana subsp. coracana]